MKPSEIRELTDEELVVKLEEFRRESLNQRFHLTTQQIENTSKMRLVRKDIARIHTVMTERKKATDGKSA